MAPTVIDHGGQPLLVFEPEADYLRNNAQEGYWGPLTSSIDWCEHNFVVSFFVAEWFNTLSNCLFIFLGLFGAYMSRRAGVEWRFTLAYFLIALVGTGSALFHGTLSHIGQQGDETPMVWATANWLLMLWFMDPAIEAANPGVHRRCAWVAALLCSIFAVTHYVHRFTVAFQLGIAAPLTWGVVLLSREWPKCTDAAVLRVGKTLYMLTAGLAILLWIADQHFCEQLHHLPGGLANPQFHAWWHVLMGANGYYGPTFLMYQRLVYLGRTPKMRWAWGLLPYVDSQQSKEG